MKWGVLCLVFLLEVSRGFNLRSKDILDSFDTSGSDGTRAFQYTPSNSNTKPPKSFEDSVEPDTSYQEAVPALQALMDMTTTAPPGNRQRMG